MYTSVNCGQWTDGHRVCGLVRDEMNLDLVVGRDAGEGDLVFGECDALLCADETGHPQAEHVGR